MHFVFSVFVIFLPMMRNYMFLDFGQQNMITTGYFIFSWLKCGAKFMHTGYFGKNLLCLLEAGKWNHRHNNRRTSAESSKYCSTWCYELSTPSPLASCHGSKIRFTESQFSYHSRIWLILYKSLYVNEPQQSAPVFLLLVNYVQLFINNEGWKSKQMNHGSMRHYLNFFYIISRNKSFCWN